MTDPQEVVRLVEDAAAIPERPTRDDALEALGLLESLLEEFPFVDDASRSVALSAQITPVARGGFAAVPMHAARSPSVKRREDPLEQLAPAERPD